MRVFLKMFKNAELNCIQRGNDLLTMQCIQCRESKNAIKTTITLDEVQGAHDNNVCTLSLGICKHYNEKYVWLEGWVHVALALRGEGSI